MPNWTDVTGGAAFAKKAAFDSFADPVSIDPDVLENWLDQAEIQPNLARMWKAEPGWSIPERILLSDWLLWVNRGVIEIETQSGPPGVTLRQGDLFVLPAGISHRARLGRAASAEMLTVRFRARVYGDVNLLDLLGLGGVFPRLHASIVPGAMLALSREDAIQAPGRAAAMAAEIMRILLYLIREHGSRFNRRQSDVKHQHLGRLQPALSLVERELSRVDLTVSQLAGELAVSEAYLRRLFRAALDIAPVQYIQRRRVQRAEQLLHNTHLSVKEVARMSGFSDEHFFMRVFRRWTRQTPTQFRLARDI